MWGTGRSPGETSLSGRVTPTPVGNGFAYTLLVLLTTGHPHVYEWGTDFKLSGPSEFSRITPTCVGNGASSRGDRRARPDHPHMRGERTFCKLATSLVFCNANFATDEIPIIGISKSTLKRHQKFLEVNPIFPWRLVFPIAKVAAIQTVDL